MDLASELGEAGFRWVFVFQDHGSRQHKLALDQASDFFTDTYHGRMVHLGGLVISSSASDRLTLSPEIDKENGLDIHAGLDETSRMLFLRPDLVDPQRVSAVPLSGQTWEELVQIGNRSRWPGYFGSPRLATASIGADILQQEVKEYSGLVLRILDGYDPRKLARQVERKDSDPSSAKYNAATAEHESRIKSIQEEWLTSKGFR
jgi:creatinine amidohydrolase/Fe(II)-dependent formamide hydrolase-like protein